MTLEPQVSLSLEELQRAINDPEVAALIESCAISAPGQIGSCAQEALLKRLVEVFGGEAQFVSMTDWVRQDPNPDDPIQCRPCAIPVTLQWYRDHLAEQGYSELSDALQRKGLGDSPLTVVEEMDRIKAVVSDEVRERLLDFDRATQANVQ